MSSEENIPVQFGVDVAPAESTPTETIVRPSQSTQETNRADEQQSPKTTAESEAMEIDEESM